MFKDNYQAYQPRSHYFVKQARRICNTILYSKNSKKFGPNNQMLSFKWHGVEKPRIIKERIRFPAIKSVGEISSNKTIKSVDIKQLELNISSNFNMLFIFSEVSAINTPAGSVANGATITITWSYTPQANAIPGILSVIDSTTKNTIIISSSITLSTQSYQWTVNVPAGTYNLALNDGSGDKYSGPFTVFQPAAQAPAASGGNSNSAPKQTTSSTPTTAPTSDAAISFTGSSIKLLFSLIVVAAAMVHFA
ncbi:9478_t:CDS:2 [Dentiscutata heterogama]|uniref:9478_t:CDS:1 n=1 Tax=Dentiscutata heterogama TaxID=1316150 RepID=A0ACA9L2A5_9GLOM|nr:9478_t:CDS:2 [Dentiscutata heterogama]